MTVIIIKDNGDTEAIKLSMEQAEEICNVLINHETAVVSNFGCRMQPHGYYSEGHRTGRVEPVALHS